MGAGFYLTSSAVSPAYPALYGGAFKTSKIKYKIFIFDFALDTFARQNASKLAFALAYSYLCR